MQLRKQKSLVLKYAVKSMLAVTMLFAILALSPTAVAQLLYGSLTGTVTDASGALLPNAHVTALEVSKGISKDAQTDAAGIYLITDLVPGIYRVTVAAPGFASQTTTGNIINANEVERVDVKLAPASATATVTVTTAPPELQTDRADVHTDISPEEIESLPSVSSEGKNFQELLRIIPGANLPAENNSASANPSRGMTSNVNGQSSQENGTRIDGVLDIDIWLPNNTPYVPPSTAIDTVNITTNSMDAEQGAAMGAGENVTIKTGSNKFHGEAHEFHTDDGMKNKNFFQASNVKKTLNVFNQFGGAVGGPIKKDKLFFFGDYEETRQVQQPSTVNLNVPTGNLEYPTAAANGYFDFTGMSTVYDPLTGNADGTGKTEFPNDQIPLSRVDPAALTLAKMIPVPTTASSNLLNVSQNYLNPQKGFYHRIEYDGKINFVPSEKTTYFGHYSQLIGSIFDPPDLDNPRGDVGGGATNGGQQGYSNPHVYVIGVGVTHAFTPNLLLDANAGYNRRNYTSKNIDIAEFGAYGLDTLKIPGTNDAGLGASNPLYWGIPAFNFTSANTSNYSSLGNTAASNPFQFRDNQILGSVNVTYVHGHHQFRLGTEDDHAGLNHFQPQLSFPPRGGFNFTGAATRQVIGAPGSYSEPALPAGTASQGNGFADFLLGLPITDGKTIQTENPIALRWDQFSLYARDQWQVMPTLSVDLGVRYERFPMAHSDHGHGATLLNPATMLVQIGGYGTTPVNDGEQAGWGEVLPRLGVAWRPDSKTVIRAGFGISADDNNWHVLRNAYPNAVGTSWSGTSNGSGTPADPVATTYQASSFTPAASLTGTNGSGAAGSPFKNLPTGVVLATLPNIASGSIPVPSGITSTTVPINFRRGYIIGYNLAVEREFAGFMGNVAYVGEQGIRPLTPQNLNYAYPGQNGTTFGALNASSLNPNPGSDYWPGITTDAPQGRSWYNSMQATLKRDLGHGSTIGVVGTYAKILDYADNEDNGSGLIWAGPQLFSKNKGLAGYNRKMNFEGYWVYKLPFGRGERWATNGIGNTIFGGWQFSGVLTALSGLPIQVIDSGYTSLNATSEQVTPNRVGPIVYTKGRPHQVPSSCAAGEGDCEWFSITSFAPPGTSAPFNSAGVSTATAPPNTLGNVGRNTVIGPKYFDLDGGLKRDIQIREWLTFEIEGTAIGLTNTPHFNVPSADVGSPSTFGVISGEVGSGNAGASFGGSQGEREFFIEGKFTF
jgi:outer membrane receptor for ferrienterochelin and colicin